MNKKLLLDTVFARTRDVFNLSDDELLVDSYKNAEPYPHLVIDGFFKDWVFDNLEKELVSEDKNFKELFRDTLQTKKTISTGEDVPPLISLVAEKFASPEMLRYLEKLTGLKKLIPDPYYNTDYGYYHIVGAGGVLGSHVDHGRHSKLNIPHVLNIVVYISPDWKKEYGGSLCLYDKSGKSIEKEVDSLANRAVIFACTPVAYHGVKPVLESCSKRRHSLYFAYYSVNSNASVGVEGFPVLQNADSNEDPSSNYGTYFVVSFKELLHPNNWIHLRMRIIYWMNYLLPPFLLDAIKKIYHFINRS